MKCSWYESIGVPHCFLFHKVVGIDKQNPFLTHRWVQRFATLFPVAKEMNLKRAYPLVNVYITMEGHHLWVHQLFMGKSTMGNHLWVNQLIIVAIFQFATCKRAIQRVKLVSQLSGASPNLSWSCVHGSWTHEFFKSFKHIYIYILHVYVYMYNICIYVNMYIYIYICIYVYIYICKYVYMYICIYAYMYMFAYTWSMIWHIS